MLSVHICDKHHVIRGFCLWRVAKRAKGGSDALRAGERVCAAVTLSVRVERVEVVCEAALPQHCNPL